MHTNSLAETLKLTPDRQWIHCSRLKKIQSVLLDLCYRLFKTFPLWHSLVKCVSFDVSLKENSDLLNTKCSISYVIMAERVDPGFSLSLITAHPPKKRSAFKCLTALTGKCSKRLTVFFLNSASTEEMGRLVTKKGFLEYLRLASTSSLTAGHCI